MPTISVDGNEPREMTADELAGILTEEESIAVVCDIVRMKRDTRLSEEVDPIVSNPLRWGSLSDEQQLAFTVYRQNLLDITEQEGFPHNVVWPTKPEV